MVSLAINGHKLYLSTRPGYGLFTKPTIQDCRQFVNEMKQKQITFIVVLLSLQEMKEHYGGLNLCDYYRRNGIDCLHYAIQDHAIPGNMSSFHNVTEVLWNRLRKENALVHCGAGIGRSGMVAAGVLIFGGEGQEKAVATVRKARPGAVETPEQRDFLDEYYHFVTGKREGKGAAL